VEEVLNKDMATAGDFLLTLKLKLSTTKMVSAVFHLNNKEAKREMKVNHHKESLFFCSEPKNLGVTLDRSLTYRRHLESLREKLTSRFALLTWVADAGWCVGATTLQTATLAQVHQAAEYCAPFWCRSARTCLIDPAIKDALRIVYWMLASYTTGQHPLSSHASILLLGHRLHLVLTHPLSADARGLKARQPFVPGAQ